MIAGMTDALTKVQAPSPNSVKLLFLITDGEFNRDLNGNPSTALGGPADPTPVANQLKALGVTIVTIGVGTGVSVSFLESIATSPAYYFPVANTADLVQKINDIVARVCPMVCKSQAFTLTADSSGFCSLPACPGATAGAACFNVYVSGAQGTPVVQTPAGPITVGPVTGQNSIQATTVTASYGSQSCSGVVTITCQNPGQCSNNLDCTRILDTNMTCGTPICDKTIAPYKCIYQVSVVHSLFVTVIVGGL
jgi:hypothetical protein